MQRRNYGLECSSVAQPWQAMTVRYCEAVPPVGESDKLRCAQPRYAEQSRAVRQQRHRTRWSCPVLSCTLASSRLRCCCVGLSRLASRTTRKRAPKQLVRAWMGASRREDEEDRTDGRLA